MQQLLNPFAQKYPEAVDSTLPSSANTVRFNPTGPFAGHYLAAGSSDGFVEVWSVETRGLLRVFEGHVKAISSISWSRNNRYIATGSLDSIIIIWDLAPLPNSLLLPLTPHYDSLASNKSQNAAAAAPMARRHTIRLDAPVSDAQFHPRNAGILLVSLGVNEVYLVDLRPGGGKNRVEDVGEIAEPDAEGQGEGEGSSTERERKKATLACAAWSPCGSRIYAGSTQGELLVFDPVSRAVLHRYKVANSGIRQVAFDPKGQNIILNATDRALRVLSVHPLTGLLSPLHRFTDLVNRTPWYAIGFSGDGEYVMGGAGHKMAHNVFIWDKSFGSLVKVLEGPRESLIDCDWHPTRPVIASVATSGDIHLWQISSPDNWAAFAPGFEELEENIEYDEREDEFDLEDETEASRRKDLEEDVDVDVLTPDDTFPRNTEPSIPPTILAALTSAAAANGTDANGEMVEDNEELRSASLMLSAREWADREPDDDTWEGFFISVDLVGKVEEDGES
ncbi:WD40-repeat-containing domain protein [Papiliotrema laurentii]|uniref:WD40-repeat-containing domain protein n=1 Tax=Papiliotrema laurentii TaxID=5418 RepID=A0AAD9CYS6_PAPLA|nr:WD40-repeat-containing domain protein [Papiliotrema laurentii]